MKFFPSTIALALCLASTTTTAFVPPSLPTTTSVSTSSTTSVHLFRRLKRVLKIGAAARGRGDGFGPPLDNISEAVGNTPMVKISDRLCPAGRTIYAKAEFFNPLSSVKDRLALSIIETAEKDGSLKPGQTVIEATSG